MTTSDASNVERRAFRAKARIVSEIGDELISSDDIALYELIKNAYDAQASYVRVSVQTPVGLAELEAALEVARRDRKPLRQLLAGFMTDRRALRDAISVDRSNERWHADLNMRVLAEFQRHSQMVVSDDGEGMTKDQLVNGFLMLASTARLGRSTSSARTVLGSKGVGRFSAKRLGGILQVDSYAAGAPFVEHLRIDWSQYATDSELFLDQVVNELWSSSPDAKQKQGTTLTVSELNRAWGTDDLERISRERLSTLMNPFFPKSGFRILARLNDERIDLHELQRDLLGFARLRVEGSVDPEAPTKMRLKFTPNDPAHPELKPVIVPVPDAVLLKAGDPARVGAFRFEVYDFLRDDTRLIALGRRRELDQFLSVWGGGGPMLFRDGFRVMPYGRPGYDWLEIDSRSFQARGTRLRAIATTGYVAITSAENAGLTDQTNREGMSDTPAFRNFRNLMIHAIQQINNQMQTYWPPERIKTARIAAKKAMESREALDDLADEVVDLATTLASDGLAPAAKLLAETLGERAVSLRSAAHAYAIVAGTRGSAIPAQSYPTLIELAGLGMAAEQLSHELLAAIDRAEAVLLRVRRTNTSLDAVLLDQLAANFGSLRRTAGFLMPLTQASRRTKGNHDVLEEARIVSRHHPAIADGRVAFETQGDRASVVARINRGVLLQVFDNLIANSLYWLDAAQTAEPSISLEASQNGIITYRDNGPGIEPRLRESVFQPFVSTKPRGRGLGLFIVRELLELQNCTIDALDPNRDGRIHGFVLDFGRVAAK